MYIEPNTDIYVLHNVPLDTTYDHTIFFNSREAQYDFFFSKKKYVFNRQSYQRVNRGFIRLEKAAELLYDCNYVMFRNTRFNATKWFYGFIKSVEYVNENVTQIEYEIDDMQTWFFDYAMEACFVEREHTLTDDLFEHIVEENLDVGQDVICHDSEPYKIDLSESYLAMIVTEIPTWLDTDIPDARNVAAWVKPGIDTQGKYNCYIYNNTITTLYLRSGFVTDDTPEEELSIGEATFERFKVELGAYINYGKEDAIIGIYQYPKFLGRSNPDLFQDLPPGEKHLTMYPPMTSIDGYRPKNNKLFIYPYNFLVCANNSGQSVEYKWEEWERVRTEPLEKYVQFVATGNFVNNPSIIMYPKDHRGIERDFDAGLQYDEFPVMPWVGDTFAAWWTQNKNSALTGILTSAVQGITTGMIRSGTTGAVTGAMNAAGSVLALVAKTQDLKAIPAQVHGSVNGNYLNYVTDKCCFYFYRMQIRHDYARIIDNYFSRFGYACRKNKVPNRAARPHWTFTKTVDCTITGSLPADSAKHICQIYNNGITFWRNGNEVGDYSLDNSPGQG